MRFMFQMLFFVFAALMLTGCMEEESHFDAAKRLLGEKRQPEAVQEFMNAIATGEQPAKAHFEIARIYERENDGLAVALWHYRQALRDSGNGVSREDAEAAVKRCEDALYQELSQRCKQSEIESLRTKVTLLEEHASRQNQWLEELRRENLRLRRKLGEQEEE